MSTFLMTLLTVATLFQTSVDDTRPIVEGVGIDEHLGQTLDTSLIFTDETGKKVALSEWIKGDVPVVIAPVYYSCPNLCTLVLDGVRDMVNELDFQLGSEYRLLNVSFDPTNTPELAAAKRENYSKTLKNPGLGREHWHYLTGTPESIAAIMDQIGFRYKKVDGQYSHTSAIVLLSPNGKITRYLYGVQYPVKDARLAILEASEGKVGATIDRLVMYCFRYDSRAGKYVPYAWRIMRIGGVLTLFAMVAAGLFFWKNEFYNRRRQKQHV